MASTPIRERCKWLPAAGLQQFTLFQTGYRQTLHGSGHLLADLGQHLGIVVMSSGDHDCLGSGLCFLALLWVTGRAGFRIQFDVEWGGAFLHEDSRSDKDSLRPKLHHEGRVGWSGYAASREIWNRQLPGLGDHSDQLIGSPMFLRGRV